jgi:hypothetical protein
MGKLFKAIAFLLSRLLNCTLEGVERQNEKINFLAQLLLTISSLLILVSDFLMIFPMSRYRFGDYWWMIFLQQNIILWSVSRKTNKLLKTQ